MITKKMIRPESAWTGSKQRSTIISKINSTLNQTYNKSRDSIIHHDNQQPSQNLHQTKSEQFNGTNKKISKKQLTTILIQLQLQKMGFFQDISENIINKFLLKQNIQQIQLKNLRRWVLSKKSQLVQILLKNKNNQQPKFTKQKLQNELQDKLQDKLQALPHDSSKSNLNAAQAQSFIRSSSSLHRSIEEQAVIAVPNQLSRQQHQQQLKLILCPICLEQTTQYVKRKCGHYFCNVCFGNYILQSINNGTYLIDCPQENCTLKVVEMQAKKILQKKDLQRFIKFKQKIQLQSNPNNKFCNKPDCGRLLIQIQNKKLYCQACQIQFCAFCQQPAHPGQLCNQVIKKALAQTYSQLNIKKCPKCSSPIQKIDGCNHMTCKKCKNQFCWICLKPYTPYHYRIYNCCGCPGLQFEDIDDMVYKRVLQVLFFIFLPLFLVLLIATVVGLLPLYILFNLFARPCKWLTDYKLKCELSALNYVCQCFPTPLINFLGYFVLFPRSIAYALFISPYMYFVLVFNYVTTML